MYSTNRILDGTLYRSSFLRLLLRSSVLDNCIHMKCDEKLSKIVAGVNSQKKLRESRYRPKSCWLNTFAANFLFYFFLSAICVLEITYLMHDKNLLHSK